MLKLIIIDAQINQFNLPNNSNPRQYNNNQIQNQFENNMNMNNFHQNMQKINEENLNLKARLNDGKNKIEELNKKISKLENQLIEEKNKNIKLQKENTELSNILKTSQNIDVYKTLFEKEKEIKELNAKLSRYPFELNEGEKLISLIFILPDQTHVSILCKNTYKFFQVEEILYNRYEKLKTNENYFLVNSKRVKRFLDLDANSIKDGDVILLNQIDDEA